MKNWLYDDKIAWLVVGQQQQQQQQQVDSIYRQIDSFVIRYGVLRSSVYLIEFTHIHIKMI